MGSPSAGCSTPPDQSATRSMSSSRGSVGHGRCAEGLGQTALRIEPGDHHHLDRRVQRPQDGDGALAERAGTVDEHLAARLRRMAGDGMERHRERVGDDDLLVAQVVRHLEEHRVVRRHEVGESPADVGAHADVDPRRE